MRKQAATQQPLDASPLPTNSQYTPDKASGRSLGASKFDWRADHSVSRCDVCERRWLCYVASKANGRAYKMPAWSERVGNEKLTGQ
jgi:hypothetical protein